MYLVIETPRGNLKYRMPTVLEAYDLLDSTSAGKGTLLSSKKLFIENMGHLIDFSEVILEPAIEKGKDKKEAVFVTSYEQLLTLTEDIISPISKIADDVMGKAYKAFGKKS